MSQNEELQQRLLILRGALRRACALDGLARLTLAVVICVLVVILLDYFFFQQHSCIQQGFLQDSRMVLGFS